MSRSCREATLDVPRFHVRCARVTRLLVPLILSLATVAGPAHAATVEDLQHMSLEDLSNVVITSVSKSSEPLRRASSTVFVITHEDIVRSGATSIAEILRLAPNLRVTQLTSSNYTVSARGFGGNTGAQNFSNKILMLIDGRSVYSPLYSGIYMDVQDVNVEDIDRIEVISGAGATLWGANAMNGVINVITKSAFKTTDTVVAVGAGTEEKNVSGSYGQSLDDSTAFRVYGKAFSRDALEMIDGSSAQDGWEKAQGGFRGDWSGRADEVTVQGDLYRATEDEPGTGEQALAGGDALTRWQHHFGRSDLTVQMYLDETQRAAPADGVAFVLHTYDLEIQQNTMIGSSNRVIWGAGERLNSYAINNTATLLFLPSQRNLTLDDVFLQDSIAITNSLEATFGVKGEDDAYSRWSLLPDARLSWSATSNTLLWATASKAIRSPTPFDDDVVEKLGTVTFLTGNHSFLPEKVVAYEVGYRGQQFSAVSISASMFYNVYDNLRTIEPASATSFLPLYWGNLMAGDTYGLESWLDWQATDRWRISPGMQWLRENLRFEPGASGLLGLAQAGDDPTYQALLKSSLDCGYGMALDTALRYVSSLPDPHLPGYVELNARYGWRASKTLEISVTGDNLLHAHHLEYPAPDGELIGRTVFAEARWTF